jgi:hypothetical protein
MLAGPDCTRCNDEFKAVLDTTTSGTIHHEEASALQTKFRNDVLAFAEVDEKLGNLFLSSDDVVALHTGNHGKKGSYIC